MVERLMNSGKRRVHEEKEEKLERSFLTKLVGLLQIGSPSTERRLRK
jgi:hypothetical protein